MAVAASLIPELQDVIAEGSPDRRAQMLTRITTLFLQGASRFKDEHVQVFDDVLGRLIAEIESKARAELSRRLAPVGNAPMQVVRTLATDDDIAVAGPMSRNRRGSTCPIWSRSPAPRARLTCWRSRAVPALPNR